METQKHSSCLWCYIFSEWRLSNYWSREVMKDSLSPQASLHFLVCASTSATLSRPWTSCGDWWVLNSSPIYICPSAGPWPWPVCLIHSRWPVASCSYLQLVLLIMAYTLSLPLLSPCPRDTKEEEHFIYHCVCILQEPGFKEGCGGKGKEKRIIYFFIGIV